MCSLSMQVSTIHIMMCKVIYVNIAIAIPINQHRDALYSWVDWNNVSNSRKQQVATPGIESHTFSVAKFIMCTHTYTHTYTHTHTHTHTHNVFPLPVGPIITFRPVLIIPLHTNTQYCNPITSYMSIKWAK